MIERPGYELWIRGKTRGEMEAANRHEGFPCYCASLWSGWCDFCGGLAPLDGERAKAERDFEAREAIARKGRRRMTMDRQQRISAIAEAINVFPGTARAMESGPELLAALREIVKGEGPYSQDRLEHASNTIDAMQELARAAIARVEGGGE